MISRDFYLERLVRKMWNGEIKVITGIRRCGKSVLLFDLFYRYLLGQGVSEEQIIKIELDQRRYYKYRNPILLCEYVESIVTADSGKRFYLFIDEVQLTGKVIDRENGGIEVTIYDMLNELKAYKNLDVYVTGSNSKGLSSDIATEFRGRASQIHVYPLSFKEYYSAVGGDERQALEQYMLYGGLPRITALADEKDKKVNSTLVSNYVQYIMDSFLISQARRYDVKGKTYFKFPSKYYYTDTGLRNARLNYRQYDPGHLMENIIYNELLRRGYSVDIGVVADRTAGRNVQKEIDFVVNDADKRIYIQSALRMDTENKADAEISSLLLAKDFFKKTVIRLDIPHNHYDDNGIFHCSLLDFLLERCELF